jgi:hypothetical protein
VNFIQQSWNFLYLIEHHPGAGRSVPNQSFKAVRIPRKLEKKGRIEQVKPESVREHLPEPCALARPPWAEQKKGSVRSSEQTGYRGITGH